MYNGNLIILVICQLISATGSIVIVTLGGIIGSTLASNKALATLPISMMVVAVAVTAVPATLIMRNIGRRKGFALGSLSSITAALVAIAALRYSSFAMFIAAAMLFGINMAFTQQYRYAAAESVTQQYVPRAISFVLLGSIGGAIVGPEIATRGQSWVDGVPYAGTMIALSLMFLVQGVLLLRLKGISDAKDDIVESDQRELRQIVFQPVYLVAVLGGTVGYGLMTLVMTATPLSMHINDGYSIQQTATVIRAHVLAMYVPSLVSGFLIERFGVSRLMAVGAVLFLCTSIIGLRGQTLMHYWGTLVLLGVGWNFLYVGGTTMLTYTYTLAERYRAQAVNEFLVFGMSATASLLAGAVMYYFGWFKLMLIPIPVIVLTGLAILLVRRDPLLLRRRQTETSS